ncbi:hypothetical protein H7X65_00040 [Candidatus Parcubacteria bacterium]|nr:hypothetical protein [Candidatus Parcubacteria bacterium]
MKNIYKAFICILTLTTFTPVADAYVSSTNRYYYQSYDYRLFSTRPNYTSSYVPYTNSYVPSYTNSYVPYYSYASYAPSQYYYGY